MQMGRATPPSTREGREDLMLKPGDVFIVKGHAWMVLKQGWSPLKMRMTARCVGEVKEDKDGGV